MKERERTTRQNEHSFHSRLGGTEKTTYVVEVTGDGEEVERSTFGVDEVCSSQILGDKKREGSQLEHGTRPEVRRLPRSKLE